MLARWINAQGRGPHRYLMQAAAVVFGLVYAASFTAAATHFTQELEVPQHDRLHITGDAQIRLVQAAEFDQSALIRLSGAPQRLRDLRIQASDGVLYVDAGKHNPGSELSIAISLSQLRELFSDGGSRVESDGLTTTSLTVESHGSGQIELHDLHVSDLTVFAADETQIWLSGTVENQYVDLHDLGNYQAADLSSQTSQVSVRDDSQVALQVVHVLDVNLFGNAQVSYRGQPRVLQHKFGTGGIHYVGEELYN